MDNVATYWHTSARAQTPWAVTVLRSGQLTLLRDIKLQQGQVISCLDASVAQRASESIKVYGKYMGYIDVCNGGRASLNQRGFVFGMQWIQSDKN